MPSKVDVQLLRTLHRVLKQKTDLQNRREKGPRRVVVAQGAENQFNLRLAEYRESLRNTQISADRKQKQLKEREDKIEDLKGKRNSCDSNREYQLLNDQIAADEQANSVLSDEILEQLEKIDTIEEQIRIGEQNLEKANAETRRVQQIVDQEMSVVDQDLQAVNQELKAIESKLPGDVKAEYLRITNSIGEDALAAVEENTCGHCCTILTTQVINELMLTHLVFCKSCGSLLYLSENASV